MVEGRSGLAFYPPYKCVHVLEAGASFKADVVPGAGAVVVGTEEVMDAAEVLVDAEQPVAGPLPFEARPVGWQALLELLDVVVEAVEE